MGKVRLGKRAKATEVPASSSANTSGPVQFFRREFSIDVVKEYTRLKEIATMPANDYRDRMKLSAAINGAALNAYRANMIFLKAKRERELFKIQFAARMRELNREATKNCEAWLKANKLTSKKQITKDMIESELASNEALAPRYKGILEELEDLREIRDNCKSLAEQWADRKSLLQTQARLLSEEKEMVFGGVKGDQT